MEQLRVNQLTFEYPHHTPTLRNLSAVFKAGTISLITGPSGSGKSTLLQLLARLLSKASHGQILYGSKLLKNIPAQQLSHYVAMMFQDPNRQFAMRTVKHELIFTLENQSVPANQIAQQVNATLANNNLTDFKNRKLNTLSGGEKQRVALAIITALNSKVILLDEPFTNVDHFSRAKIMHQLVNLKHAGKIIIIVDHDLQGYQKITDQLLIMKNGQLQPAKFSQFQNELKTIDYQWQLPNDNNQSIYQIKDFSVGYRKPLITTDDFKVFAHRATLITGPNGSGKSTLFKALLNLIKYHGQITYQKKLVPKLKPRKYYHDVNLVFQEPINQFLEITVKEELDLSTRDHTNGKSLLKKMLKFTGLDHHLNQVVYSLSGGQQKSLQLIEILISNTPIMLMDEPFQSLDHRLIQFFKQLLKNEVQNKHRTLIVISHQIAPVADLFDYHIRLASHHLKYLRGLIQ
ncbi:ATP-binding cassette domain-containing protein [Acetilactobacillus jinshanensis]|uniref:ABC transporter ATP-binding protein n=1 Tax=Acetilactobacillus jinshanensis TaxID=1720083 RepID=A0A4P6ZJ71_9LACO|nr:ABC transporter ATP-binding protein [Acetilactobacillus jinshanensis]QBP17775.1 ABC transporter ATP-binding protein [Acetilactobacillus jinshanensis]URL60637.1 ABC transporter ATP-binding protein [uncultured bacterium]